MSDDDPPSIVCPRCSRRSYHPMDIEHRYCGVCGFHDTICHRVLTKEQMIAGLKSGRTLVVDRKDAPELPELLQMEEEGLVTSELVIYDEQSSALKFKWRTDV